jgi:amino acid permease
MLDLQNMPLIFGIFAFSYAGHSVFPSIQAAMRRPSKFPRVLDTAYCIVAAICTFLGFAGYYMYGNGARDVITFNMSAGVHRLSQCACQVQCCWCEALEASGPVAIEYAVHLSSSWLIWCMRCMIMQHKWCC